MSSFSIFESRTASLSCTPEEFYSFVTDMRNFHQFIPDGTAREWESTPENCRINVPPVGNITIWIGNKVPCSEVLFSGNSSQIPEFYMHAAIAEAVSGKAEVKLKLSADLNPFIKLIAATPLEQLMNSIVEEMEKFNGWTTINR
jgi:hypothetical protein